MISLVSISPPSHKAGGKKTTDTHTTKNMPQKVQHDLPGEQHPKLS